MDNLGRHRNARALLSAGKSGVLSTLSVDVGGYPFGSVVPYCLDRVGRPIVLISDIAQHTKNVTADPRLCLTVLAAGEDVQASARLSILARAARMDTDLEEAGERYYRHFPGARSYGQVHGFAFTRLEPVRFRWIGGFGDIRWIEPEDLLVVNPFTRDQESAIVIHMNDDHADTMRDYCRKLAALRPADDAEVAMAGIDAEGFDLLVDGRLVRMTFPQSVATPGEARAQLVALAR